MAGENVQPGTGQGTGESDETVGQGADESGTTEAGQGAGANPSEKPASGSNDGSAATAALTARLEQQTSRTRAADNRAAKLEAELREIRDRDLPELDRLKRDKAEADERVTSLTESNRRLSVEVAFLKDTTHSWENPAVALQLLQASGAAYEIAEDGTVTGLAEAAAELAKNNPWMLKKPAAEDPTPPPATVSGANGGNGGGAPSPEKLKTTFPMLRTRRRMT